MKFDGKYLTTRALTLKVALALSIALPMVSTSQAQTTQCKIKVVGGSFKGQSFTVKMVDGSLIGQSGMTKSALPGCQAKKMLHGRWYHLCTKGTLIVYKRKDNKWKLLKPKSLKKYKHNCF